MGRRNSKVNKATNHDDADGVTYDIHDNLQKV
jgi:hypothetical protein